MARDFESASLFEDARFNQAVVLPNALQGLFKRRPKPVAVATRMNVDGQAVGVMQGMRRAHGSRPLWVHLVKDRALLLLDAEDVARALDGSPQPFAADPPAKRSGMSAFQPDALTISRGELWKDRRAFAEAVLDTPHMTHRLGDRFVAVVREELSDVPAPIDYDELHAAYRRITRRVVFGDEARDDEELSRLLGELMSAGNGMPSERPEQYEPFMDRIAHLLAEAPADSLAGLIATAPSTADTQVAGQIPHWLFATQDTLSANVLRAYALIGAQPEAARVDDEVVVEPSSAAVVAGFKRLRATLLEAMRLWPTTPLLSRELVSDVVWHGIRVSAGTQVLIPNMFHHRDEERLGEAADRFTPEGWIDGDFASDRGLNFLSSGPQGCPGSNVALLIGTATLAVLCRGRMPGPGPEKLGAGKKLPNMLDVFGLTV